MAVLTLLDERPMHGYELITEFETRSEGRWRPSPGAIYPALEKMESNGAVTSTDVDGKRQFALTDRGRQMLAEIREAQGDDADAPWNHTGTGGRGELRRLMSELGGQVRQIARFGSTDQRDAADGRARGHQAQALRDPRPPRRVDRRRPTDRHPSRLCCDSGDPSRRNPHANESGVPPPRLRASSGDPAHPNCNANGGRSERGVRVAECGR